MENRSGSAFSQAVTRNPRCLEFRLNFLPFHVIMLKHCQRRYDRILSAIYGKRGIDMRFEKVKCGSQTAAIVSGSGKVIVDVDSALDLLMSARYEADTKYIVVDKQLIAEDFFILSSGLAGEILQKYVNYGGKLAIYGDFSQYTSKPLKDFIFESNKGNDVFFAATKDEALQKLANVI